MRKLKNNKIMMIILLIFTISITGCSTKKPDIEDSKILLENNNEDLEREKDEEDNVVEDKLVEDDKDLDEEDTPANEEEMMEEGLSGEDKIDSKDQDNDKAILKTEETIKEKKPDKVQNAELPKEEVVEKKNAIKIKGNVGKESTFTLDELKNMTEIIFEDDFYSLNNFGTTGYTHFKGVNLWKLLEQKSDISTNASKIKIIATDGYEVEFTIEQVKRQDYIDESNPDKAFPMIIAWEEEGKEYNVSDGPPYKLIVGQTEAGDINKPQWVSKIDRIIVE